MEAFQIHNAQKHHKMTPIFQRLEYNHPFLIHKSHSPLFTKNPPFSSSFYTPYNNKGMKPLSLTYMEASNMFFQQRLCFDLNHLKSYKFQSDFCKIVGCQDGQRYIKRFMFAAINLGNSLCPNSNLGHYEFSRKGIKLKGGEELELESLDWLGGQFIKRKRFGVFIRRIWAQFNL